MLGNGVKRKLNQVEDGLDEGIVGTMMPPGAGTGTVHAAVGGGGLSRATYALQRQTVLNMSLMKLYGPRAGPDPGLQRRVLINNMIRHIHEEFKQEGGGGVRALFFAVQQQQPAAAPRSSASADVNGDDEGYHRQAPSLPPPPSFSILSSLDSCLTPASLLEEDSPLFFALPPPSSSPHPMHHYSSPQPPPPPPAPSPQKDSFSTALEEIEELCPTVVVTASSSPSLSPPYTSPSLSPPYASSGALSSPQTALSVDVSMKEVGQNSQKEEEEEERTMEKPAPPLPLPPSTTTDTPSSPSAQGFLTDFALDDILFTDIDTSMYDFGPGGGGTSPSSVTSSASKMAPGAMADDLVKTISSYGGTGGGSSQNQPFKMDLAELDHIMEVLVGS